MSGHVLASRFAAKTNKMAGWEDRGGLGKSGEEAGGEVGWGLRQISQNPAAPARLGLGGFRGTVGELVPKGAPAHR